MVTQVHRVSQPDTLGQNLFGIGAPAKNSSGDSFGQELASIIASSLKQAGIDLSSIQIDVQQANTQGSADKSLPRQIHVTYLTPVKTDPVVIHPPFLDPPSKAVATVTDAAVAYAGTMVSPHTTVPLSPVDVLSAALLNAGVSQAQLNKLGLTEVKRDVQFPGGSYPVDYIAANGPNGGIEGYDARATVNEPSVTVTEIKHFLLGMPV